MSGFHFNIVKASIQAVMPYMERDDMEKRAGKEAAAVAPEDIERVRQMAERLDCLTEEEFMLLASATRNTVEAWRRRHTGPAWLRFGNRVFYPRKAIAEYFASITKESRDFGKALL